MLDGVQATVRQLLRRACGPLSCAILAPTLFATTWSDAQAQAQQAPAPAVTATATASGDAQAQTPAAATTSADAQAQTPADAGAPPDMLKEVVVTAQKRAENAQTTPIAMSVLSGSTLSPMGLQSFEQVLSDVPSVQPSIGPGGMRYTMRGVNAAKNSPSVSTSVDGVATGSTGPSRYLEYSMYDVSRIEVLEGPQGTLYGRNTLAGEVNIVTNDPVDRYESSATLGYGNYDDLTGNAMLNIPLSDSVQMRAAFSTDRRNGYMSDNQSDENYSAGRLKFLITPTKGLVVHLTAEYMEINEHGNGESVNLAEHPDDPWLTPNITIPGTSAGLTNYCAVVPISGPGAGNSGKVNDTQVQCALDYYLERQSHLKGEVDYDLGFAGLTVLGGYESDWTQDNNQAIGIYPPATSSTANQTSIEARLASEPSSPIKWVFGTYWQRNLSGFPDGLGGTSDAGAMASNVSGNLGAAEVNQSTKSVFSQATFPITHRFRAIAGLRYNEDFATEETWTVPEGVSSEVVPPSEGTVTQNLTPTPGSFNHGYGSWSKLVWKAGLEFDLAPQSLLYATVGTGYSAGMLQPTNFCQSAYPYGGTASNPGCYTSPTTQNSTTGGDTVGKEVRSTYYALAPNALTSYEIGVKNRFLDNRLQVNADVFFMDFSDLQEGAFGVDATGATNSGTSTDLKGSTSKGVELSTIFLATSVDMISLDAAYNPTKIGDPANPWSNPYSISNGFQTCIGTDALHIPIPYGCHGIVTGNSPLQLAPLWSGNLSYEHTFALGSGADILAHADTHFQSSTWGSINEYPDSFQASWAELNVALTYESADGRYKISGYVRNVANRAIITDGEATSSGKSLGLCQPSTPAMALSCGGTPVFIDLEPPRTYGATVTVNLN